MESWRYIVDISTTFRQYFSTYEYVHDEDRSGKSFGWVMNFKTQKNVVYCGNLQTVLWCFDKIKIYTSKKSTGSVFAAQDDETHIHNTCNWKCSNVDFARYFFLKKNIAGKLK